MEDLVIAHKALQQPARRRTLQGQEIFVVIITSPEPDVDLNLKQPTQITQSDRPSKTFILASISSTKSRMFSLNSHTNSEIFIINPVLQIKKLKCSPWFFFFYPIKL